jgi:hypothetical protein
LGYKRKDAWLCDLLPETRLNASQVRALKAKYEPIIKQYGLNQVTIPKRPTVFCDLNRSKEILAELSESKANLLVLLGDIPIQQFLNRITKVNYTSLQEYVNLYGYGNPSKAINNGENMNVLPLAHPRQIGALGAHNRKWFQYHLEWENNKE